VIPVLVVFAAALPRAVVTRWRQRAWWRLSAGCLVIGLALGLTWLDLYEPSKALVHYNRAVNAYHDRRLEDALEDLDAALAEDAGLVQARLMRAELWLQRGRLDAAGADLEVALPLARGTPREAKALVLTGRWHAASGHSARAIEAFEQALAVDPGAEAAAVQAALAERALGRTAAAKERLAAFIAGHPRSPGALNLLGVLRADTGDLAGAERSFREALGADPHDVRALANLARCVEQGGRREEALTIYERLLREDPANEIARRKVAELSGGR
jgi:tetratricopeptide (TPR) repeat protein